MTYLRYLWYVLRHKWYVLVECWKRGLYWRGIMHDMSKFRPDEFIPYARYFYGKKSKPIETIKAFHMARLLHRHRNPHHWQYWVSPIGYDGQSAMEMPQAYRVEMVCDWRGAGKATKGYDNTFSWYYECRDSMVLHPDTRAIVEIEIGFSTSSVSNHRRWMEEAASDPNY
jgi:hypothetical protein